jgi:hypothetical protein
MYPEVAMLRRSFLSRAAALTGLCLRARTAPAGLGVIAFTQTNGLWLRDLPDGKPRLLVCGAKIDSPRFSPSGQWLTYFQDESLYLIPSAGGSPRALAKPDRGSLVPGCQWFPHSDDLLVPGPAGLRILSPANGWTGNIPHAELPVVFSPDGLEIVYGDEVTVGRGPGGEPMRTGRLSRVALARPDKPQVLFSKYSAAQSPVFWTGDSIIFREDPDFSSSIAADGLTLFRLPASGGSPQSLGVCAVVDADMLSLSIQGKLAVNAGFGREDWCDRRIAILDPAAAAPVRYLTGPNQAAVSPAWSPSGDRIAYSAAPVAGTKIGGGQEARRVLGRRRIWVADAAGAAPPSVLTREPLYRDEEPMWSADGSRILFCRIDLRDRKSLWLMDSSGASLTKVADLYTDPGLLGVDGTWFGYYGHIDWRRMFDWRR